MHLVTETGFSFITKMEKPPKQKKGETISFGILPELAHYFDKQTGKRLSAK